MTHKCPACQRDNEDNDNLCRGCGTPLSDDRIIINNMDSSIQVKESKFLKFFNIRDFLKDNFQLFAILGVVGTMIIFLPNLGDRIIGPNWMTGDWGFLAIFIAIMNCVGGIFFIIIFWILLNQISENRHDEEIKTDLGVIKIRYGDFDRIICIFCLFGMMIGISYFIFIATVLIPNIYAILICLFILLLVYITVFFCLVIKITSEAGKQTGEDDVLLNFMRFFIPFFAIVIFLWLTLGQSLLLEPQSPHDVAIQVDQEYYSSSISTTPGIKLLPTNSTNVGSYPIYQTTHFHWMTNYGYFVYPDPFTSKIYMFNNDTLRPNRYIYWTYPEDDRGKEKPNVTIKLDIYDINYKGIITNSSLNITWTDQGIAKVQI